MDELSVVLPPNLEAALQGRFAADLPAPAFAARLEGELRMRHAGLLSDEPAARNNRTVKMGWFNILRARPLLAALCVLLALVALTGIAYAISRAAGFIPGFGFTSENGEVYVLAEPVEASAGNVSLRIDQAVADSGSFWVSGTVTGDLSRRDFSPVNVLLPGGESLRLVRGGSTELDANHYNLSYRFPPLPHPSQLVTLQVEDLGGQDFTISLKLRPARSADVIPLPAESSQALYTEEQGGVRMVLEQVAMDSQKTVLQVSLVFSHPNTFMGAMWNVTLADETGMLYPMKDVTPDTGANQAVRVIETEDTAQSLENQARITRVFETLPFHGDERLTLRLVTFPPEDGLPLIAHPPDGEPAFIFEPGTNPRADQRWQLDKTFTVNGFELRVIEAVLVNMGYGLEFTLTGDPAVTGMMLMSSDPIVTGAAGGIPSLTETFTTSIELAEIPNRPIPISVSSIYYRIQGEWVIEWQPPAAPVAVPSGSGPTATPALPIRPTPTLADTDSLLREMQDLTARFDAALLDGPGWIHIVRETETLQTSGRNFPPPYMRSELWYEVDADGIVQRSTWTDFDADDQMIQQAATVGDYSVNFTYAFADFGDGKTNVFSADGTTPMLSAILAVGGTVTVEDITCPDSQPCLLLTMVEPIPEEIRNPDNPHTGAARRIWLDQQTGRQIREEAFWLEPDGSETLDRVTTIPVLERVDSPPQEILDLLARVVVPEK